MSTLCEPYLIHSGAAFRLLASRAKCHQHYLVIHYLLILWVISVPSDSRPEEFSGKSLPWLPSSKV